eukprot:92808-Pelagomonas_calceolata.AAC.7
MLPSSSSPLCAASIATAGNGEYGICRSCCGDDRAKLEESVVQDGVMIFSWGSEFKGPASYKTNQTAIEAELAHPHGC